MRTYPSLTLCLILAGLTGCSSSSNPAPSSEVRVVPVGEQGIAGHLTYSVSESQEAQQLGDGAETRTPQERFILVQVAINNTGNTDSPIPAITLVDSNGKEHNELTDGTGVSQWLGVVRHVAPNQTERGIVIFDAPPGHFRMKISDETMTNEVLMDLPSSVIREKASPTIQTSDLPTLDPGAPAPRQSTPAKKK